MVSTFARIMVLGSLVGGVMLCSSPVLGDTLTFNPGTVAAGSSAAWDTMTTNWLNGSTPSVWTNTTANNASFGGPGVAVVLGSGGVTAGGLSFTAGNYTFSGGTLSLIAGGTSNLAVGSGLTETFNNTILNGFTKTGTGTVILGTAGGANLAGGPLTVSAGIVKLGASSVVNGTGTVVVGSAGTFDLAGYNDTFVLSAASAGTITSTGTAGTLTVANTAALTYTGNFAGNLSLADTTGSAGLTLAGTVASTNTGAFTFNALVTNYLNNSGGNALGGNVTLAGGGVTLLATNQIADTATVAIDISKPTAVLNLGGYNETIGALNSSGTSDGNAHVNLGSGTLTINSSSTSSNFAGIIAGSGSLLKQGTSNLTLTGANTFTGGVTVKAGTLIINNDAALGVSGTTYGALTLDGGSLNGGSNNVVINANRTVNVGASASFNVTAGYALTLTTPLVNVGASVGNVNKSSLGTLASQATSGTPFGAGSLYINAGTVAFQPSGSGANVALSGVNTSVSSRLGYGIGSALGISKGSNNSVTLTLGNGAVTSSVVLIRSNAVGTLLLQPSATANLGNTEKIIVNGGVTMTNGIINPSVVVQDQASGATLRGDFVTDAGGTTGLKIATYTNTNFTGTPVATDIAAVTASTTLGAPAQVYALKVGAGGTGAPTTLTVGAGNTLTVGGGVSGTQAGVILNGTTSGTGFGPAGISGGTLAFGAAEGLVYVNSGGGQISSAITGSGGLTVFGNGVLTLGGANTLTGPLNLNASAGTALTLRAAAANTLPTTTALVLNSGSVFDLAGYNQTIATVTGSGGTALGSGTLTVGDSTNFTYGGVISGTGSLVKQGSGTMVLSVTSTYTGGTFVNAGTLQIASGSNRLPQAGAVTVASGATLDLNNQSQTIASLSGPGTVTNSGNTATPNLTLTYSPADSSVLTQDTLVTGQLNYVKNGTGTVIVSTANTYTGTTAVTGGTLKVGVANAVPVGSALTVGTTSGSTAATFDLNGNSVTVGGLASGATTGAKLVTSSVAGPVTLTVNNDAATTNANYTFNGTIQSGTGTVSLVKSGTMTLTLGGTNTFNGTTTVAGGTLTATATGALGSTAAITVNNGGTLLLGGTTTTDRVNNAAPITLAGGTITKGADASEGVAGSSTGAASTTGLGALTLTANSRLDFGTGAVGTLVFSSLSEGGNTLAVDNWTGTARTEGVNGTNDRLLFAQAVSAADLASVSFTGFGTGAQQIALTGGYYELVPVPEPATWVSGLGLIVAAGWTLRRRLACGV